VRATKQSDHEGRSEKEKPKSAFEKIRDGLYEARAYLDNSADKRNYRVHLPPRHK